jgi:RNA recognition motif-containing protein
MDLLPVKIFMSGYPREYDELVLVQLVSPYGQVSTIKIVRDKQSGKPKGYSFIEMVSRAAAEEVVIGLDGIAIKEKTLTVNIVEEPVAPVTNYRKVERDQVKKKRPRLPR